MADAAERAVAMLTETVKAVLDWRAANPDVVGEDARVVIHGIVSQSMEDAEPEVVAEIPAIIQQLK